MSKHFVTCTGWNISQEAVPLKDYTVTLDGRTLSDDERKKGCPVEPGKDFEVQFHADGAWPVIQKLRIDSSQESACVYAGPTDDGAHSLFSHTHHLSETWNHIVYASLTLFQDAGARRAKEGQGVLSDTYRWDVVKFSGIDVLGNLPTATYLSRFAANVEKGIAGYDSHVALYPGSTNGQLCYLMTPDNSTKPRLAAVYVPDGIDWTQPVPVLVFLTPYTTNKAGNYPWSNDFNAMLDNYLVNVGKRLLHQINASGKKCVFVFPIPIPQTFYNGVQQGLELRRYLLEVVYWLQCKVGQQRYPQPKLGHCAVAAFSGGGDALRHILETSTGSEFPEFREVYGLDTINNKKFGGYAAFKTALGSWWKGGKSGKVMRFYESDHAGADWGQLGADFGLSITRTSVGGAVEYQGQNATSAWLPTSFWEAVWQEDPDPLRPVIGYFPPSGNAQVRPNHHQVHQVLPGIFLEHALRNSAFGNR